MYVLCGSRLAGGSDSSAKEAVKIVSRFTNRLAISARMLLFDVLSEYDAGLSVDLKLFAFGAGASLLRTKRADIVLVDGQRQK